MMLGPRAASAQTMLDADMSVRETVPDPDDADDDEPMQVPRSSVAAVAYESHASSGSKETGGGAGSLAMTQLSVSTGFPVFFDGTHTMLAVGLTYAHTTFDTTGTTAIAATDYHTFKPTFTFIHELSENWGLVLRYVPNLTTNMNDVTFGHVNQGAQVIATYKLGPHETFYMGLAYSQVIPWYVLPGVGYELFKGRIHVEARMPEKVEFAYMLTPRVELGVLTRFQNTLFGIGGVSQIDKISYTTVWSGFECDVRLAYGFHLQGQIGRTWLRRFSGMNDGTRTSTIALDQTMVGRVNLSYDIER
jgi:hypothetical protein